MPPIPIATSPSPLPATRSSRGQSRVQSKAQSKPSLIPDESLHFDYPGSDIILRSHDSHDFRVPQLYLVNSSTVLRELIQSVSNTPDVPNGEENTEEQTPLPVVKLPESGVILHSLLTFIFPVVPILPSITERIMELLSVAQKYRMDSVMAHIRGAISRQDPPFVLPNTALHIYFLAQKYELHQEALLAARSTLRLSMTIEDLENKIGFMPGVYLRELWKYHERVREGLESSLPEFRELGSNVESCGNPPSSIPNVMPQWLSDYIESIPQAPHLFDLIEFENARASHIQPHRCNICPCISSEAIRTFWEALTAVVHQAIEKADLTLSLVKEEPTSENWGFRPVAPPCLDVPDANIIIRSSDQVNFRVHKSLLSMSSPFFSDLLSLPQPPDGELADGLPVIQLSEDADLLNSLLSFLYPISPYMPGSYGHAFPLLAACQKYDMVSIQSYIRAEIKRWRQPVGAEAFRAYAIASSLGLTQEAESAARLTLGYPMTFESLGDGLRSFKGRALCDLIRYRRRCRDNVVSCLDSFFDPTSRRQTWAGCREGSSYTWLINFFTSKSAEMKGSQGFTRAIFSPSTIIEEFIVALKDHTQSGCYSCPRVHMDGQTFCKELEREFSQGLDEVCSDGGSYLGSNSSYF
ncbi:hypothetical protein H4582DRAFT_1421842 [Lactarius indigo]|nr:hypothetical protein H4582DRAFT_1421842 [Lactarius indigo]